MPRYDLPLDERMEKFRNFSKGKVSSLKKGVVEDADDNKEENCNSSTPSSLIDFSLYLREPKYTLNDVILPKNTKKQIESVLAEIKHYDLIYNKWGIGEKHKLDKALSVNFSGPPGTGKTLAAEALAYTLKSKIIVLPYSQLESKYVGDTPKNIVSAFTFAAEHKAILFFDEADSFLGKRLENVTQSTDTAVNLTRSVMITQLSNYEGVIIFATNLIGNYDPAFLSRIRWKLHFELPDEESRKAIWKIQIPDKLPLDNDVDFSKLASEFKDISGRDIKNAVLKGVVSAAKEDKPDSEKKVNHSHLFEAISDVVESNKSAVQEQHLKLNPVEGDIRLPQEPNITEEKDTTN
ncbi:ATP-dependent zinc metalloprotease FtsH [Candidatus Electronema halotolerans]